MIFPTCFLKGTDTVISRNILRYMDIDVDQYITLITYQQRSSLHAAHVIVCCNAAYTFRFPFNGDHRNIIGSQFFRGKSMAENNKSFNLISHQLVQILHFFLRAAITDKNQKFVMIVGVTSKKLCQHFGIIMKIKVRDNDPYKFAFPIGKNPGKLVFSVAELIKGFCDLFLIFQSQRIRMIEISRDRGLGKTRVFCNIGKCYLFFSHKKIFSF